MNAWHTGKIARTWGTRYLLSKLGRQLWEGRVSVFPSEKAMRILTVFMIVLHTVECVLIPGPWPLTGVKT